MRAPHSACLISVMHGFTSSFMHGFTSSLCRVHIFHILCRGTHLLLCIGSHLLLCMGSHLPFMQVSRLPHLPHLLHLMQGYTLHVMLGSHLLYAGFTSSTSSTSYAHHILFCCAGFTSSVMHGSTSPTSPTSPTSYAGSIYVMLGSRLLLCRVHIFCYAWVHISFNA